MAYPYYNSMNYPQYPQMQGVQNVPLQNQPQQNNGIIWVVGENGADSYLVAPGQTVLLWDSTAPVIYVKSADSMGRPSKRIYDYTERGAMVQSKDILPQSDFAKQSDVDYLKNEIESLRAKFGEIEGSKKK